MLAEQAAPRKRDPEGRRRAILTAAAELVVENGAAALTHRAVAARAEVPLGSTTQYFASIDELRESALQLLADEIEVSLARMEPAIPLIREHPAVALAEAIDFLSDRRAVLSDIALLTTAVTDPRLNALALRWTDRLVEMLAVYIGRERAMAIALYLDGAAINAGISGAPIPADEIARTLKALVAIPDPHEDPGARSGS